MISAPCRVGITASDASVPGRKPAIDKPAGDQFRLLHCRRPRAGAGGETASAPLIGPSRRFPQHIRAAQQPLSFMEFGCDLGCRLGDRQGQASVSALLPAN
jgi:hypothetical protein